MREPFAYVSLHWVFRSCEAAIAFCLIQIVKKHQMKSNSTSEKSLEEMANNSTNILMSTPSVTEPLENRDDVNCK